MYTKATTQFRDRHIWYLACAALTIIVDATLTFKDSDPVLQSSVFTDGLEREQDHWKKLLNDGGYEVLDVKGIAPYASCILARCTCGYEPRACCEYPRSNNGEGEEEEEEDDDDRRLQGHQPNPPPGAQPNPPPGAQPIGGDDKNQQGGLPNEPGGGVPPEVGFNESPNTKAFHDFMCTADWTRGMMMVMLDSENSPISTLKMGSQQAKVVNDFSISQAQITRLNDGVALITYQVAKDWLGNVNMATCNQADSACEVYVKGNGMTVYQWVKIERVMTESGDTWGVNYYYEGCTQPTNVGVCVQQAVQRSAVRKVSTGYELGFTIVAVQSDPEVFPPRWRQVRSNQIRSQFLSITGQYSSIDVQPLMPLQYQGKTSRPDGICRVNESLVYSEGDYTGGLAAYRVMLIATYMDGVVRTPLSLELTIPTAGYTFEEERQEEESPNSNTVFVQRAFETTLTRTLPAAITNEDDTATKMQVANPAAIKRLIENGVAFVTLTESNIIERVRPAEFVEKEGYFQLSDGPVRSKSFGAGAKVTYKPEAYPATVAACAYSTIQSQECGNQFAVYTGSSNLKWCICSSRSGTQTQFPAGPQALPAGKWDIYSTGQAYEIKFSTPAQISGSSGKDMREITTVCVSATYDAQLGDQQKNGDWTASGIFISFQVEKIGDTDRHRLWAVVLGLSSSTDQAWGQYTAWEPARYANANELGDLSITGVRASAIVDNHALVICEVYRHKIGKSELLVFAAGLGASETVRFGEPLVIRDHALTYSSSWKSCNNIYDVTALTEEDAYILVKGDASCVSTVAAMLVLYNKGDMKVSLNTVLDQAVSWENFNLNAVTIWPRVGMVNCKSPSSVQHGVTIANDYFGKSGRLLKWDSVNKYTGLQISFSICEGQQVSLSSPIAVAANVSKSYGSTSVNTRQRQTFLGICTNADFQYTGDWTLFCQGANSPLRAEENFGLLQFIPQTRKIIREMTEITVTDAACRPKSCFVKGDTYGYIVHVDGSEISDETTTFTGDYVANDVYNRMMVETKAATASSRKAACMNGFALKSDQDVPFPSYLGFGTDKIPRKVNTTCIEDMGNFGFSGCEPVIPIRLKSRVTGKALSAEVGEELVSDESRYSPVSVSATEVDGWGVASMSYDTNFTEASTPLSPGLKIDIAMVGAHIQAFAVPAAKTAEANMSKSKALMSGCVASYRAELKFGGLSPEEKIANQLGIQSTAPKIVKLGTTRLLHICKYMPCQKTLEKVAGTSSTTTTTTTTTSTTTSTTTTDGNVPPVADDDDDDEVYPECPAQFLVEPIDFNSSTGKLAFAYTSDITLPLEQEVDYPLGSMPIQFDVTELASLQGGNEKRALLTYTKAVKAGKKVPCEAVPAGQQMGRRMSTNGDQRSKVGMNCSHPRRAQGNVGPRRLALPGQGVNLPPGQSQPNPQPSPANPCADYSEALPQLHEFSECENTVFKLYATIITDFNGVSYSSPVELDTFPTLPMINTVAMPSGIVLISCLGSQNSTSAANGSSVIDTRPYVRVIGFNPSNNEVQKLDYGQPPVFSVPVTQNPTSCQSTSITVEAKSFIQAEITLASSLANSQSAVSQVIWAVGDWSDGELSANRNSNNGILLIASLGEVESAAFKELKIPGDKSGICRDPQGETIIEYREADQAACKEACAQQSTCNSITHLHAERNGQSFDCCWLLSMSTSGGVVAQPSLHPVTGQFTCWKKVPDGRSLNLRAVAANGVGYIDFDTTVTTADGGDYIGGTTKVGVRIGHDSKGGKLTVMFDGIEYEKQQEGVVWSQWANPKVCVGRADFSNLGSSFAFSAVTGRIDNFQIWNSKNRQNVEMMYDFRYAEFDGYDGSTKAQYSVGKMFALNNNFAALIMLQQPDAAATVTPPEQGWGETPAPAQLAIFLRVPVIECLSTPGSSNTFALSWKAKNWDNPTFDDKIKTAFGKTQLVTRFLDATLAKASASAWSIILSYLQDGEAGGQKNYRFTRVELALDSSSADGFKFSATKAAVVSSSNSVYANMYLPDKITSGQTHQSLSALSSVFQQDFLGRKPPPVLAFAGIQSIVLLTASAHYNAQFTELLHVSLKFQAYAIESCAFAAQPCQLNVPRILKHTADLDMKTAGSVNFDLSWSAPCSYDKSEALGYRVCTASSWSNDSYTSDCGGCGSSSSEVELLTSVPATTTHQSTVAIPISGQVKRFLIVCTTTGDGALGRAVATEVLDSAPHACTLGDRCKVSIQGADEFAAIKLVRYTEPRPGASVDDIITPWRDNLVNGDGSFCKTEDPQEIEPGGRTRDKGYASAFINSAGVADFDLGVGVSRPGYYGICMDIIRGAPNNLNDAVTGQEINPNDYPIQRNAFYLNRQTGDGSHGYFVGLPLLFPAGAFTDIIWLQATGNFSISALALVGVLSLYGPAYNNYNVKPENNAGDYPGEKDTVAVRGQSLSINLDGLYSDSFPKSRVMISKATCASPVGSISHPNGSAGYEVFGWPTEVDGQSGLDTFYGVSTWANAGSVPGPYIYTGKLQGVSPSTYWICVCAHSGPDSCKASEDYTVRAGELDLIGPYTPTAERICFRGLSCRLEEYGILFTQEDRIHICQNRTWASTYNWDETASFEFKGDTGGSAFGALKVTLKAPIVAAPGQYSLCWNSGRPLDLGVENSKIGTPTSLIRVVGPPSKAELAEQFQCRLGSICKLTLDVRNPSTELGGDMLLSILKGEKAEAADVPPYDYLPKIGGNKTPSAIMLKGPFQDALLDEEKPNYDPNFLETACTKYPEATSVVQTLSRAKFKASTSKPTTDGRVIAKYEMDDRYFTAHSDRRMVICWCSGLQSCTQESDFLAMAGTLILVGPYVNTAEATGAQRCAIGSVCQVVLQGFELTPNSDKLMIKTGSCKESNIGVTGFYSSSCLVESSLKTCRDQFNAGFQTCAQNNACQRGLADFPATQNSDNSLTFRWSGGDIDATAGTYSMCYCGEPNNCKGPQDFRFYVNDMTVDPQPTKTNYVCVTGEKHECTLEVVGNFGGTEVKVKSGGTSEPCLSTSSPPGISASVIQGEHNPSTGNTSFVIGKVLTYGKNADENEKFPFEICWCGNRDPNNVCSYHRVHIGNLMVVGPSDPAEEGVNQFKCVLGQWCNIPGLYQEQTVGSESLGSTYTTKDVLKNSHFQGVNLTDGDYLVIVQAGYCGSGQWPNAAKNFDFTPSTSERVKGRSAEYRLSDRRFSWTTPEGKLANIMGISPGGYELCWCRPQQTGGCDAKGQPEFYIQDYLIQTAARMTIAGPNPGQKAECVRGRDCHMTIKGVDLADGDVLQTIEFLGICGGSDTKSLGQDTGQVFDSELRATFGLLKNISRTGRYANPFCHSSGIYKICWCKPIYQGKDCVPNVEAGSVLVKGPLTDNDLHKMGDKFDLNNTNGIGLSTTRDYVMLLKECGKRNNDGLAEKWVQSQPDSHSFLFGILSQANIYAGTYQKCWCQYDVGLDTKVESLSVCGDNVLNYNTPFGALEVYCPEGQEVDAQRPGVCVECARGRYLGFPSPRERCLSCPTKSNTSHTGSLYLSDCICHPGYAWDKDLYSCEACSTHMGDKYYCPGRHIDSDGEWSRAEPHECPDDSEVIGELTPSTIQSCLCHAGFAPNPANITGVKYFQCESCEIGTFKKASGNAQCESCQGHINGSYTTEVGRESHLDCKCPAGTYELNLLASSVPNCETCPQGYYCDGSHDPSSGFDGRKRCDQESDGKGSTTNGTGKTNRGQCLCDLGYSCLRHEDGLCTACTMCSEGRFKDHIGNVPNGVVGDTSECLQMCPPNMTSSAGAVSESNCICMTGYQHSDLSDTTSPCIFADSAAVQMGESTFQAPAVSGKLNLVGMTDPGDSAKRRDAGTAVVEELKSQLGIDTPTICTSFNYDTDTQILTVDCDDMSLDMDFSTAAAAAASTLASTRRLESDSAGVKVGWTIRTSETKAKLAAQNFQPDQLATTLKASSSADVFSGLTDIDQVDTAMYTRVNQSCPDNKAKPPGAPFQSVEESCKCQAGFFMEAEECKNCPVGRYKSVASDGGCQLCDPRSNVGDTMRRTGKDPATGDPLLGETSMQNCFCRPGYYGICNYGQLILDVSGVEPEDRDYGDLCCGLCPRGQYCPDDLSDNPVDCDSGSQTTANGSDSAKDCECLPGFGRPAGDDNPCTPCPERTYKDTHKDDVCSECPQEEMGSFIGSVRVLDCFCLQGFYHDGECKTCQEDPGLICEGGFYNRSGTMSKDHVLPLAKENYYLSGNARSLKCPISPQGAPICLGGREEEVWNGPCLEDCNCIEGMDGFMCQNCKTGWTRDDYTQLCEQCPEVADLYFRLSLTFLEAIVQALLFHGLTYMALRAGQGTKSLHSTLLRLWQSWAISMSVLRTFDFTQIEMFSWSAEAIQMAAQAKSRGEGNSTANGTSDESGMGSIADSVNTLIPWPDWFDGVAAFLYGIDSVGVDVGTPTKTAECLAEYIFGADNATEWKYIASVIYYIAYPLVVILVMIVIDLLLIWVAYPPLERNHFFHPKDPKELKTWLFNLAKPELMAAMESEELGTAEEHKEKVAELCSVLYAKCSVNSVAEMKLLLQHPREGLAALSDLFLTGPDKSRSVFTPDDLGKAKMAMALLSRAAILKDLSTTLSTGDIKNTRLDWPTAERLDITAEQMMEMPQLLENMVLCASFYNLEEWFQMLKGPQSPIQTLIKSGKQPARLQLAFCLPLFQATAHSEYRMHRSLSEKVWASMNDALCTLGPETVQKILELEKPLDKLLNAVESKIPGSGSFLIVAEFHEQLGGYFRENFAEYANGIWETVIETMLVTTDADEYAEQPVPSVRIPAVELKPVFDRGLKNALYHIACRAGTGPGGYLLGMLRQADIIHYLESMPGVTAARAQTSAEVQTSAQRILRFCYTTDFDEVDQLLPQEGGTSVASLVEACTRAEKDGQMLEGHSKQGQSEKHLARVGAGILGAAAPAAMAVAFGGGNLAQFGGGAELAMGMAGLLNQQNSIEYPVFDLFRANPSIKEFFRDFAPLFWIALYSMWYETTRRLLLMLHCENNIEEDAEGNTISNWRWAKQMNMECYTGPHMIISLLAGSGLLVWSFGLLIVLGYLIIGHKKDIQSNPQAIRVYSYFVTGYEADRCYWDIVVKKSDNLMTIVFTYSSFAPDLKAKILLYAALAMFFLTTHNLYLPFDDRKNMLCDHIENIGLRVRFMVFGLLEMLLIFSQLLNIVVASVLAFFTLSSCAYFLFFLWMNILCEFFADISVERPEGVMVSHEKMAHLKALSGEEEDKGFVARCTAGCSRALLSCAKFCCLPMRKCFMSFAKSLANVRQHLEEEVLCFMPAPNFARRIQPRVTRINGCCQRLWHRFKVYNFYQGDGEQREFIVGVLGNFVSHLLCQLEEERIEMGNGLLGRFLTISAAFKEVTVTYMISGLKAADIAEMVKNHLYTASKAAQDFITLDDSSQDAFGSIAIETTSQDELEEKKKIHKLRLTGEDLNDALMFLQRLTGEELNSLLMEAAEVNSQISQEMGPASRAARAPQATPRMVRQISDHKSGEDRLALANDAANDDAADAWKKKAMEMMGLEGIGNGNGNSDHAAVPAITDGALVVPAESQGNGNRAINLRTIV